MYFACSNLIFDAIGLNSGETLNDVIINVGHSIYLSCRMVSRQFSLNTFVLIKCDKMCSVCMGYGPMETCFNVRRENVINIKHSKHFEKLETVFNI